VQILGRGLCIADLYNMSIRTIPRMVSISDLQRKARQIFEELDDAEPTLVLSRNRTVGVVLKPNIYEELMDELEDIYIGERLEKLVQESSESDFEDWDSVKQELFKDE